MLPAYAGMIRRSGVSLRCATSAPRVCGDDPSKKPLYGFSGTCSPRMRG